MSARIQSSDRVWISASRRLSSDPCWVTPWHLPDELGEQASILGRESLALGHLDIAWQVSCHFNNVRRIRRATVAYQAPRARQHRPAVPHRLRERAPPVEREVRVAVVAEAAGEPVGLIGHRFQNPCDGMRNARLKREDAFSHAMIIVSSAMVSSS